MVTLHISVPESVHEWIQSQIAAGGYADVSDYVSDLIVHDREAREALVEALIAGEKSGISSRTIEEIVADAKKRIQHGEV